MYRDVEAGEIKGSRKARGKEDTNSLLAAHPPIHARGISFTKIIRNITNDISSVISSQENPHITFEYLNNYFQLHGNALVSTTLRISYLSRPP